MSFIVHLIANIAGNDHMQIKVAIVAAFFGVILGILFIWMTNYLEEDKENLLSNRKLQVVFTLFVAFSFAYLAYINYSCYELLNQRHHYQDTKEPKYEAVVDKKVEKYINCYDKNDYHICEADDEKFVVEDYWKIGETNEKN